MRAYAQNTATTKWCGRCEHMLSRSEFKKRKCSPTQNEPFCIPCMREYDKLRMRRFRERVGASRGAGYTNDVLDWSKLPAAERRARERHEEKFLTNRWTDMGLMKRVEAERSAILEDSFSLQKSMLSSQEFLYDGRG